MAIIAVIKDSTRIHLTTEWSKAADCWILNGLTHIDGWPMNGTLADDRRKAAADIESIQLLFRNIQSIGGILRITASALTTA